MLIGRWRGEMGHRQITNSIKKVFLVCFDMKLFFGNIRYLYIFVNRFFDPRRWSKRIERNTEINNGFVTICLQHVSANGISNH